MDHYDHHAYDDSGFSDGSTDHSSGDWHHDQQFAMAGDDHDLHARHGNDVGFGDSHHDYADDQGDQDHPAGCPCCCDTATGHEESHQHDPGGSDSSGSHGSGAARSGQVGSVGGDHPWAHSLGALHSPGRTTTATSSPQPAVASGSLVPSAPLPSASPDSSEHGGPDTITITDDNPVFAKLLAEYGNDPEATPENIPNLLSRMPPAAAAQVGDMVDHFQATKEAGVDTWVDPDGVSAVVPFDGTSVDFLARDGSSHLTSGAADEHNRFG